MSTPNILRALAKRCEKEEPKPGTVAAFLLDSAITAAVHPEYAAEGTSSATARVRPYTSSLDAAVTLVPPNTYWHVGKGKLTADEPLYGAIVEEAKLDSPVELGGGESDKHEALALCAAALKARAALAEQALSSERASEGNPT